MQTGRDTVFEDLIRVVRSGSTFDSLQASQQLIELAQTHPSSDHIGNGSDIEELKKQIAELRARLEQAEAKIAAKR